MYYGVDEISASERNEFLVCYEAKKDQVFDKRRFLESCCQHDVGVLREACRVLRREFINIGNIDVFLESVNIASACNKVLRKQFLKPNSIGIISPGGYTGKVNYSNKAIMWLLYREQTDGCTIIHTRNGREYRPPELPRQSVDRFCAETRNFYEFFGCLSDGHNRLPFRKVTILGGDNLAVRYEQTKARLQPL